MLVEMKISVMRFMKAVKLQIFEHHHAGCTSMSCCILSSKILNIHTFYVGYKFCCIILLHYIPLCFGLTCALLKMAVCHNCYWSRPGINPFYPSSRSDGLSAYIMWTLLSKL